MKQILVLIFVFMLMQSMNAQFAIRNDFVISGKEQKIRNLGITFISINFDRHPNLNSLINGRGGNTLLIYVDALRHSKKRYTYEEIAEKIYVPNVTTGTLSKVPLFLLIAPENNYHLVYKPSYLFKQPFTF